MTKFLALICLVLAGCSAHWQQSRIFYGSYGALWKECKKAVERQGYSCKGKMHEGRLKSDWQNALYPLRKNGWRTCVELGIEKKDRLMGEVVFISRKERQIGFYQVKVKVLRQLNYSVHDFMDPRQAVWLADGYDSEMESLLIADIESEFYLQASKKTIKPKSHD